MKKFIKITPYEEWYSNEDDEDKDIFKDNIIVREGFFGLSGTRVSI